MGNTSIVEPNLNNNKEDIHTLTYRVKLPDTPIISAEKDIKYLLYSHIEDIENGKACFFLPAYNEKLNLCNQLQQNLIFFLSFYPVITTFIYRYLRISRKRSRKFSFFISISLGTILYYYPFVNLLNTQRISMYAEFIFDNLLNDLDTEGQNEYFKFKSDYLKSLV